MTMLADNPVLVKHLRSRLRRHQVIPALLALLLLAGSIWWIGFENDPRATFTVLLFLQGAVLLLGGTSQVALSVSKAHASGILDFHRSSPLPARVVVLGFLLGAPIREYLGFAVVMPFTLLAALSGPPGLPGAVVVLVVVLVSGLLFHALALVFGLLASRSRSAGAGPIGLLVVAYSCSGLVYHGCALPGLWTAGPVYAEVMYAAQPETMPPDFVRPTFFGAPWSLAVQSLIYQLPMLAFLLLAAVRRMAAERAHLYSRPAAVLLLVLLAVLAMGGLVRQAAVTAAIAMPLVLSLVLAVTGALALAVTPDWLAYSAGLRRAARRGTPPGAWSDQASNRVPVMLMAVVTALAGAATAALVPGETEISWRAVAVAGAAVLAFGFALQWLALAYRRRAIPYFVFLLFLWLAMPLIAGTMLDVAGAAELGLQIRSLCPFSGIFQPTDLAVWGTAGLAVVFGGLLWLEERNVVQALDSAPPVAAAVP